MSTELKYLALTSLLTASLWIPYIVMSLGMSLLTLQIFVQAFRKQ